MENPIQYLNTDHPSQMGGGFATTVGGLSQQPISVKNPPGVFTMGKPLWYAPWSIPQRGETGLMKTLHRASEGDIMVTVGAV